MATDGVGRGATKLGTANRSIRMKFPSEAEVGGHGGHLYLCSIWVGETPKVEEKTRSLDQR